MTAAESSCLILLSLKLFKSGFIRGLQNSTGKNQYAFNDLSFSFCNFSIQLLSSLFASKKKKQNKDEGTKRSDAAHRTALFQRAHKDSQGERVKGEQLEQNNGRQEERVRIEDEDGGSDGGAGMTETRQRKKLRFYWRHKA